MLKTVKAKSAAGKRELEKREPQVHEGIKQALFLKANSTSEIVSLALKDLYSLKKPEGTLYSRKNDVKPFEDPRSLEFFSQKTDAGLMVIASHTKKRPHTLTFARMYDHQLLDMVETGITGIRLMDQFKEIKAAVGQRPLMVFQGDAFETLPELMTLKSIFLDLFRGDPKTDLIDLKGLEHVVTLTAVSDTQVCLRVYSVALMKSKETPDLPRVELKEMGPRLDLTVKRVRTADPEVMKQATKVPKELLPKKEKNIEHDAVGHQYGRIHMEKQDLNKLETRKMKGLKGVKRLAKTAATATDVNV